MADTIPIAKETAQRDLDATAWAVALAAPGLFAGLGQADKLFKATRFPEVFGYVFGTMLLLLLYSMFIGLKQYTHLHSILSVNTTMQMNRVLREGYEEFLRAEWAKETPDMQAIEQHQAKVRGFFKDGEEQMKVLETLLKINTAKVALFQRHMLEWAYLLFIVIILTSNFYKLVS